MKIFKVAVMEVYRKVVSVQANNEREAHERAWDAWLNTEIILDLNDFEGAEIEVLSEGQEIDKAKGKFLEALDYDSEFDKGKGTAKNA